MEPSTRPYNPNGHRAPRGRGAASAKRAEQTTTRQAPVQQQAEARVAKPRGRRPSTAKKVEIVPVLSVETAEGIETGRSEPVQLMAAEETRHVAVVSDVAVVDIRPEPVAPDVADAEAIAEPAPLIGVNDFEDIFTRFQTPITNFIYRLVGNREQAYDLAQDVFVKAYRALSGGATIQAGALSSWLYRIASNTATDALRRRRLISWLPLSLFNDDRGVGAGMPGVENGFGQQTLSEEHLASAMGAFTSGYDGGRFEQRVADREVVERVLKRLPEKYAACLLLYEHEGFSCAEIADVLHVTPSAVKMRLMRARERFISIYQQEMEGRQ